MTGHLFQGRFASAAMDEERLIAALRYLASNPAPARLVGSPADWRHASVAAHLAGRDDALFCVEPALRRVPRFADLPEPSREERRALERFATRSANGRPLGGPAFLAAAEQALGRRVRVRPRKRGPHPQAPREAEVR